MLQSLKLNTSLHSSVSLLQGLGAAFPNSATVVHRLAVISYELLKNRMLFLISHQLDLV
jgi:hypothetical protein